MLEAWDLSLSHACCFSTHAAYLYIWGSVQSSAAVALLILLQMMMNFTVDCVRGSKDGVLLLITADAG